MKQQHKKGGVKRFLWISGIFRVSCLGKASLGLHDSPPHPDDIISSIHSILVECSCTLLEITIQIWPHILLFWANFPVSQLITITFLSPHRVRGCPQRQTTTLRTCIARAWPHEKSITSCPSSATIQQHHQPRKERAIADPKSSCHDLFSLKFFLAPTTTFFRTRNLRCAS